MTWINAHFDGKTIVPDEPVELLANQKLRVTIEVVSLGPVEAAPADGLKIVDASTVVDEAVKDATDYHAWIGKGLLGPRNPNPLPESDDELWGKY